MVGLFFFNKHSKKNISQRELFVKTHSTTTYCKFSFVSSNLFKNSQIGELKMKMTEFFLLGSRNVNM